MNTFCHKDKKERNREEEKILLKTEKIKEIKKRNCIIMRFTIETKVIRYLS
jgi:hypothetical protein